MGGHYANLLQLVKKNQSSDTFAKHFAFITIANDRKPTQELLRTRINFSILWQGNPVSVQKTFGTKNCLLCTTMKERTTILNEKTHLLINNNSEIFGSCRHKPRLHRFPPQVPALMSPIMDERVPTIV